MVLGIFYGGCRGHTGFGHNHDGVRLVLSDSSLGLLLLVRPQTVTTIDYPSRNREEIAQNVPRVLGPRDRAK